MGLLNSIGTFLKGKLQRTGQYTLLGLALATCGDPQRLSEAENEPDPVDDSSLDNNEPSEQQLPNPSRIAFSVSDGTLDELVVAAPDGMELQRYSLPWHVLSGSPCWTQDGRSILLYPSGLTDEGIFQLDIATGGISLLLRNAGWAYAHLLSSQSGEFSLLATDVSGTEPALPEIAVLRGSDLEQVTTNLYADYSPAWLPDGRLSYVASTGNEFQPQSTIYVYDGEHHRELPVGVSYVRKMAWAPDWESLIFFGGEFGVADLYRVPAAGGNAELLANMDGRDIQWSPDGSYLMLDVAATSFTHRLYRFDVAERQLVRMADTNDHSPAISADSEWVLFLSDRAGERNLFKMRQDGTSVQQLTFLEEPYRISPAEWEGYCR